MSQSQAPDVKLENYHLAIESFEYVESLFNYGHVDLAQIHQELFKCHERLENIISEENTNSPHLVHLFLLKELISDHIKLIKRKIAKQAVSSPKIFSDMQKNKKSTVDTALEIVKSTIEIPRVNGLNEIAGLWEVKKVLKSLVILPQNQQQLFVNRKAYNSVLLFGPPGTGKTHLVHALASDANAVLHCVSISSMVSSFVGQTEKNIHALFEYIKSSENFSILFIDEVDGICRSRRDSEHDHSHRMKTELMCEMSKVENVKNMFLICATNCPWDLDTAFLRRFHKRIYVPLPNIAERHEIFQLFTKNIPLEIRSEIWNPLVQQTEGFSGSDLSDLVQSALNTPIMELEDTKIWKYTADGFYEPIVNTEDFSLENIVCCDLYDLPHESVRARPLQALDFLNSLNDMTATVSATNVEKFESFINK